MRLGKSRMTLLTEYAEIQRELKICCCKTLIEDFTKTGFTDALKVSRVKLHTAVPEKPPYYLSIGEIVTLSHQEIFCGLQLNTTSAEEL